MKFKNIVIYFKLTTPIFLVLTVFVYLFANTIRDLGKEPELSRKLISQWIIFYTNIERLKNGRAPLQYDPDLEKAAEWQAEYCAKVRALDHIIQVKDMSTPKDRIERSGGKCGNCGENLTVKFGTNSEGIPFFIKNDEKGTYYDYGDYPVYWRNEQQMGYSMLDSWMKSTGHRKNILNADFKWIGAGAVKGIYSNNISYYGCQVFNGYGGLPHDFIKTDYQLTGLEVRKNTDKGKDAYIILYNGTLEPGIIELNEDRELITHKPEKNGNELVFIKNAQVKGLLFAALYDKKQDMLYPVAMLR